jgi:hypothetical protein
LRLPYSLVPKGETKDALSLAGRLNGERTSAALSSLLRLS